MTLPNLFQFDWNTDNVFNWGPVVDEISGAQINNATVTMSLYKGRYLVDPVAQPGTVVTGISNLSLSYVGAPYYYQVQIPKAVIPEPGGDYVVVVDSLNPGTGANKHIEIPAIIRVPAQ